MSHFLCPLLLLFFLTGGAVSLVKASESDNIIRCGYDNFCQATLKFISAVNEIKSQLDDLSGKQARDAEELKVNLNRSLASMDAISKQLGKHSADLLGHDDRLKSHDVSQSKETVNFLFN